MALIAPSILSADFSRLGEEIKAVEKAGADWIHLDIMDGNFVPNITIGAPVVRSLRPITSLPFDVHLMVCNPEKHVDAFIEAGADILTVHAETTYHLHRLVTKIREKCKVGVALNPSTSLSLVEHIIDEIDMLVIMTVNPGFGGQKFIKSMFKKIKKASLLTQKKDIFLQVDGGVNEKNAEQIKKMGANVLVAGSAVFGSKDYASTIKKLK
ncbi:MAG: ribulose-phosphate 3-epimerase [Thermoplasmata archaeon]|nr:MAG: ribulose-phosphate 3-epimerase [Thermoplasmata archaeon]